MYYSEVITHFQLQKISTNNQFSYHHNFEGLRFCENADNKEGFAAASSGAAEAAVLPTVSGELDGGEVEEEGGGGGGGGGGTSWKMSLGGWG